MKIKTLKEFRRTGVEMTQEAFCQIYGHDGISTAHKLIVYECGFIEAEIDGTYSIIVGNRQADDLTKKEAAELLWDWHAKHEMGGLTSKEQFADLNVRAKKFIKSTMTFDEDRPILEHLDEIMRTSKNQIGSTWHDRASYLSDQISSALQLEEQEYQDRLILGGTFEDFLKREIEYAKKNEGEQDVDKSNFIFNYLLYVYNYDVEGDEEASTFLLRATEAEAHEYVLDNILPTLKK